MAITIQQIHATADQLQEQGIKPTLAEVRKILGGGSFTCMIHRHHFNIIGDYEQRNSTKTRMD